MDNNHTESVDYIKVDFSNPTRYVMGRATCLVCGQNVAIRPDFSTFAHGTARSIWGSRCKGASPEAMLTIMLRSKHLDYRADNETRTTIDGIIIGPTTPTYT